MNSDRIIILEPVNSETARSSFNIKPRENKHFLRNSAGKCLANALVVLHPRTLRDQGGLICIHGLDIEGRSYRMYDRTCMVE